MVEVAVITLLLTLALCSPWVDGRSPASLLLSTIASLSAAHVDWLKVL
jgi:hypothetical protein